MYLGSYILLLYILRGWGDKYLEGGSGKRCREGYILYIYGKGKREETNVCVVYISIKKSTVATLLRWTSTGDGETDISIAKGFDNQKGPATAVTARRIRSFRNANLWTIDTVDGGMIIFLHHEQIAKCQLVVSSAMKEPYGNRRAGKVVKNDTI